MDTFKKLLKTIGIPLLTGVFLFSLTNTLTNSIGTSIFVGIFTFICGLIISINKQL